MPSCLRLVAAVCVASFAVAQRTSAPALAIADALRRGDAAAAAALAAAEPDLARRALLEAALAPLAQRPAALLAVAQRFAQPAVRGTALIAGLVAVASLQDRAELAEGSAWGAFGREDMPGAHDPLLAAQLTAVIPQLLALAARWEGEYPDDADAPLLRRLARAASCSLVLERPLPVLPETPWPVPRRLAEDLLVAVRPLGDAEPDSNLAIDALAREPVARWLIAASAPPRVLRAPGAGRWLLEVQSVHGPWRALRVVDVTSLCATALCDEAAIAFHVRRDGGLDDAPVRWSLWSGGAPESIEGRGCAGVLAIGRERVGVFTLLARTGDERACAEVRMWQAPPRALERHVAHWQFDRPLHRPGEMLRGRVAVRSVSWTGLGLAAVPATAALAHHKLQLRVKWPGASPSVLAVATDDRGFAPFECEVPAGALPGFAGATLEAADGVAIAETRATTVANFRRPAMVAALEGPTEVDASAQRVQVTLRVQWASGGAAAGVPAHVEVWSSGRSDRRTEARDVVTGEQGTVAIPIAVAGSGERTLTCTCAVSGVDGFVEHRTHTIRVVDAKLARRADAESAPHIELPDEVVVGETVGVRVTGPRFTRALAVVGRGTLARAEELTFDGSGATVWEVAVTAADWPRLDLAVAHEDRAHPVTASAVTRLQRATNLAVTVPANVRPKERVVAAIATAPHAVVTVAVADDRVFRLAPDRTLAPDAALRPHVDAPRWRPSRSDAHAAPELVLGELLVDGRVPAPTRPRGKPGPAGGASGGPASAGMGDVRTDFRATVCFLTVAADATGAAQVAFDLPDDVTTWRLTATAVDARGEGGLAVATMHARLPLAAEPVLPRVLRRGDRVQVPLVLDRAIGAVDGADRVAYAAAATGALRLEGRASGEQPLAAGAAAVVPFELAGDAVGAGSLALRADAGALGDRSERALPVASDVVVQPVFRAGAGRSSIELAAPARDPGSPLTVTVLAGGAAAWKVLAQRLERYPYGCIEQTLSGLLPFAAASAAQRGATTPARAERIGKGMARMRQLQVARGGAFAWWPGQSADVAMTGLALHGLAALRAGGVDPAAYGIECDVDALGPQWQAAGADDGAERAPAVELLAGLLRMVPAHAGLRAAAAAAVDDSARLTRGAQVRLGLALAGAGDDERARRCLSAAAAAAPRAWFPGDERAAVAAQTIELRRALGEAVDAADEVQLLRDLLAGDCRTYADGAALVALAPSLPAAPGKLALEVAVDGAPPVERTLDPDTGSRVELTLPAGDRCVVRCRDGEHLLFAQVRASRTRPPGSEGWAEPFVVHRELMPRTAGREVRVGERLRVRVEVVSPVSARYVAIVCPLPAGFEVLGDDANWQRFDDRVATTRSSLRANGAVAVEFDVVATMPGRVAWPPATAEAMYDAAASGGSAGEVLVVAPRAVPAAPPIAAPFLAHPEPVAAVPPPQPAPLPRPPSLVDRAYAAWQAIDTVWSEPLVEGLYGFGDDPDETQRADVDAAFATLREVLAADDEVVRGLLDRSELVVPGRQWGGALSAWQRATLARCDELAAECVRRGAVRAERQVEDGGLELADLLARLPVSQREVAALRLLPRWWPDSPSACGDALATLEAPLHEPQLEAFVASMLATARDGPLDEALRLLPGAAWHALPATLLVDLLVRDPGEDAAARIVAQLAATAAGRQELVRRAHDAAFVAELTVPQLPDDVIAQLPPEALAELAEDDPERAARVLAAGATPTAVLWRLLLARGETLPLSVLVAALRARGAIELPAGLEPERIADPTVRTLVLALAAGDDAAKLPALLAAARDLRNRDGDRAVDDAVEALVGERLAHHGSAMQLREFASWLGDEQWARAWPRLAGADARTVLTHDEHIGYGAPGDDDGALAMFARAHARDEVGDAVLATLASPTGERRLRELLPRLPDGLAQRVRDELAQRLALDAASLQPVPVDAATVAHIVRDRGWLIAWPPHLVAARDRLLRWRGLL